VKLVDVNVLVYAVNRRSEHHAKVLAWWNSAVNGDEALGLPWIAVSGFLRITTNPRLLDYPLTIAEAVEQVDAWLAQPNVRIVQETGEHWLHFRTFIQQSGTAGNRTTDAHLAALAVSYGATLASCDADFARFRQLRWENPAA
jgi:toxin-antitoxin system PIN domain toxin